MMWIVISLLVVIVLLLCTPLKHRVDLLRTAAGVVVLVAALHYIPPVIGGLLALFYGVVVESIGWRWFICILAGSGFLTLLAYLWKADHDENKAIRAGSTQAFDARVDTYMRDPFNYDYEKAVEVTARIRDEKRSFVASIFKP